MSHLPEILLLFFILNLGTAFGAGLYETKIIIPVWFHTSPESGYQVNAQAMQDLDAGRKFWAFVTTIPLTLLTLANLVVAWRVQQPVHDWWLAAAGTALIERTSTFAFFIPTAIKFQTGARFPAAGLTRLVQLWIRLNYVRNGLTLLAWLFALKAISIYQ